MAKEIKNITSREKLEALVRLIIFRANQHEVNIAEEMGQGKEDINRRIGAANRRRKDRETKITQLLDQVEQESLERGRNLAGQPPL